MGIKEAFMQLTKRDSDETPMDDEAIKVFVAQVAEHLGMEQYKTVLQRADEVIKTLTDRIDILESLVAKLAADDVERIKAMVTDGDWTEGLFSAAKSGEDADEEDAAKAKEDIKNRQQGDPLGMEAFFGGGK